MKGEILDEVALWMTSSDNVATAIDDLQEGREIEASNCAVTLTEDVPFGHKLALEPIEGGEKIRKYGEVIGQATQSIAAGDWVHTHNCESTRGRGDLSGAKSDGGETA